MGDTPINLENILEQAPKWTFAGDFILLQWMNQISQDLESRATKTSEALSKLNNNIRSTNTALDNVANSLTTLQFGNQFVECRVQDDDETLINSNDIFSDGQNQPEYTPTTKELFTTFLDNNLKVLRNCHEKYSIDLEDSDDDDEGKPQEKTCIYQPINPYNERPLPFIFGSKDWLSTWHVGLYENQEENSYSADEVSDAFSESSSTTHLDDNESFESNTEWASSNSMDNENLNTNIDIQNALSLRGSQPLYPGTISLPINAAINKVAVNESSSLSTPSSSFSKKSSRITKPTENLTQRSESKNSIDSKNSSKTTTKVSSNNKENSLQYKAQPQTYVDLFAEPPEDLESISSSSVASVQNIIRLPDNNQTMGARKPSASRSQPSHFVDLFAEPPEDIPSSTTSSMSSGQNNIKRRTVNLFEDDEDDIAKNDLLTAIIKKQVLVNPKNGEKKTPAIASVTDKPVNVSRNPKSLFEDSEDEEDDFLKAFVKKTTPKEDNKTSSSKTLLFDNELPGPSLNNKLLPTNSVTNVSDKITSSSEINANKKIRNVFIDIEEDGEDYKIEDSTLVNTDKNTLDKHYEKENVNKSASLFNNFKDVLNTNSFTTEKKHKKINLFDELDDGDDLFSINPKQTSIKKLSQEVTSMEEKPLEVKAESETTIKKNYSEEISKKSITNFGDSPEEKVDQSQKIVYENDTVSQSTSINKKAPQIIENSSPQETQELTSKETVLESQTDSSIYDKQEELNNNDTIPIINEESATTSTSDRQKSSSSNKYEFNSILFLDEPPEDDNAFFETLTKTPQTSTNYNTIDLENDTYEPELPKVPVASSSNNQTDISETRPIKLYTDFQLFSDIPPDDDSAGDAPELSSKVNQTKRLHGVFYDDFNETLMALNQNQLEKEIPTHSIFSNEPPSINDELISLSNKVPDVKQDMGNSDLKFKNSETTSKLEESLSKSDNKKANENSAKRSVSKLQMPHININVQALLPGANNTFRKAKEDSTKSNAINHDNDVPKKENESNIIIKQTKEIIRNAETEHILPSVTKNRVRAPATRRPSTRRARQENYRKSLVEEQTLVSDVRNSEIIEENTDLFNTMTIQTKTRISKTSPMKEEPKRIQTQKNKYAVSDNPITKNQTEEKLPTALPSKVQSTDVKVKSETTALKGDARKLLESSSSTQNVTKPVCTPVINTINEKSSSSIFEQIVSARKSHVNHEIKTESALPKSSLLFDDEDYDDLFKDTKTSKANEVKENKVNLGEKNNTSSSNLFTNNTNIEVTKNVPVSSDIWGAAEHTVNITKPYFERQQPTEEQDNSEQCSVSATSILKPVETKTNITNQSLENKGKPSFLDDDEDDDGDLFKKGTIEKPPNNSRFKDNNSIAKSKFKSFLDSESDEDLTVAGLQTAKSADISTLSSTKNIKISIPPPKNNNIKLFTNSDTDSDDLFEKLAITKIQNYKTSTESTSKTQTQLSLFGDETDGDDFPISSRSISKNTASKSVSKENKPKIVSQTNESLFSDIDSDEDDLFGGGNAKVNTNISPNVPSVKATPTSKPNVSKSQVSKPTIVADNPLADLL